MNKKRILQKRMQGSITVYVFILLGMSIVLYMFGFTNMLGGDNGAGYLDTANLNQTNSNISDPNLQTGKSSNPVTVFANAIASFAVNNPWATIGGIGGAVITLFISGLVFGKETTATFFGFIIPIGILAVILNYLVFPINTLDENLRSMTIGPSAFPISVSLLLAIFFNLFFFLGVLEYWIGRQT